MEGERGYGVAGETTGRSGFGVETSGLFGCVGIVPPPPVPVPPPFVGEVLSPELLRTLSIDPAGRQAPLRRRWLSITADGGGAGECVHHFGLHAAFAPRVSQMTDPSGT